MFKLLKMQLLPYPYWGLKLVGFAVVGATVVVTVSILGIETDLGWPSWSYHCVTVSILGIETDCLLNLLFRHGMLPYPYWGLKRNMAAPLGIRSGYRIHIGDWNPSRQWRMKFFFSYRARIGDWNSVAKFSYSLFKLCYRARIGDWNGISANSSLDFRFVTVPVLGIETIL